MVMHHNHGSPKSVSAKTVLGGLSKRVDKLKENVQRETIKLRVARGTLVADVTIGRKTLEMTVDDGAKTVTLTSKNAADLDIKIPIDARGIQLALADGTKLAGKRVVLPVVRIGQFEARNVEATVLDPEAEDAFPVLGASFLDQFRFEIDRINRSLKLLQVSKAP